MRTRRLTRLLAGTALLLIVSAPTPGVTAPERVEVRLPPASIPNVRPATLRRDGTSTARRARQRTVPAPLPPVRDETVRREAPAPQTDDNGNLGLKGTLDRFMSANDAVIADKLRTFVDLKQFDRHIDRAADRKAIAQYYAERHYAPLWLDNGQVTAQAKVVMARLKDAAADGLSPSDYPVPDFDHAPNATAMAQDDILLTGSLLTFARHLSAGRIAPRRVFAQVEYGDHTPDPVHILKTVIGARDTDAAIESFNPPHRGFRALKRKLAELRAHAGPAHNRIPDGPAIRPGHKDARVPLVRARLGLRATSRDDVYDRRLTNAIRRLQYDAGLKPTGIIDNRTLARVNGPTRSQEIDTVLANMERWRWLPRDLGETYVMVNVPDFTLKLVHDHKVVWRTKIVAGKPQTPTPMVSAIMDQVIVNPSWYVPQSIIHNELLPLYANDPNIFDRMGLEVKKGPDGHINVVQPPGARNALGRIKFNFPNKFQVYLHDTPEKRLFAYDRRAFSHGCMRVQDPTKFGEYILSLSMNGRTPNARQLQSMFGREEHDFKLAKRPHVLLTYQTAFVDDQGRLQLRNDLYGFDARIYAILHSDERRVADVPPPPDPKRDLATAQANQDILRRVERREAQNPFVFFEKLFR